jgi:predicted phosphodiesterase
LASSHLGTECGHPVSKPGVALCRTCWRERGNDLPPGERKRDKFTAALCGHPVKIADAKYCRDCYRNRGATAPPVNSLPQSYDDALGRFKKYIGQSSPNPPPAKHRKFSDERIIIASDFHAPFQHPEAFAALCRQEADTCIVAGDLQDHYGISRFLKYETVPIQQELAAAQLILSQLSAQFPHTYVIEGNHDTARFEKLLADRLPHEAIDIIRFLSKNGSLSSVEALCGQFRNVELVKHKVGARTLSWFMQKGDLLVSHAEKYSRVPGSALRGIEEWFSDFEHTLNLKPWRVIVQAHTHAMAHFPYGPDKVLVETGCMCQTHGYQLSARIAGRPQRLGWTTMSQRDGVTDLSSIRLHWYQPKGALE